MHLATENGAEESVQASLLWGSYGYLKQNTLKYYYGIETSVLWREVVPISEGPLSKVPLYVANKRWNAPAHEECSFKNHCRTAQGHVVLLELEFADPALRTTAHACHLVLATYSGILSSEEFDEQQHIILNTLWKMWWVNLLCSSACAFMCGSMTCGTTLPQVCRDGDPQACAILCSWTKKGEH